MNSATPERSIAVLPLLNLSADPENEYFSDGMTEEIINALSKVQGLKVTARTSSFAYKAKDHDIREIGNTLGVTSILEGSVRKAGDRLRISVQLVQASDGFHLWSERFDRKMEDVFALQDEISLLVVDKIRENFGHLEMQDSLVDRATENLEAYQLFLKAHELMLMWRAPDIEQAIELYKAAISKDEKFARAYYELIWCYYLMAAWGYFPPEQVSTATSGYLEKAEALDRDLPEYHFTLATQNFWLQWNFKEAYHHLKATLEKNPQFSLAIENMAEVMLATGHFDKAIEYTEKCLRVDPLSANHYYTKAHILYFMGRCEEAIPYFDKALNLSPDFELAAGVKALCLILLGNRKTFEEYQQNLNDAEAATTLFDLVNGSTKHLPEDFNEKIESGPSLMPWKLLLLARSSRVQDGARLLKEYICNHLGQVINFRYDPMLKPLREFPEIKAFLDHGFVPDPDEKAKEKQPIETNGAELELERIMQEEELFLHQDLNLRSLAEKMDIHPNKLSWLINEALGKNFNEYINGMRLEAFKQKALDPENSHITLLGLAYESGFNSKSVFNDFFKKSTGMTPRAWVKAKEMEMRAG